MSIWKDAVNEAGDVITADQMVSVGDDVYVVIGGVYKLDVEAEDAEKVTISQVANKAFLRAWDLSRGRIGSSDD